MKGSPANLNRAKLQCITSCLRHGAGVAGLTVSCCKQEAECAVSTEPKQERTMPVRLPKTHASNKRRLTAPHRHTHTQTHSLTHLLKATRASFVVGPKCLKLHSNLYLVACFGHRGQIVIQIRGQCTFMDSQILLKRRRHRTCLFMTRPVFFSRSETPAPVGSLATQLACPASCHGDRVKTCRRPARDVEVLILGNRDIGMNSEFVRNAFHDSLRYPKGIGALLWIGKNCQSIPGRTSLYALWWISVVCNASPCYPVY